MEESAVEIVSLFWMRREPKSDRLTFLLIFEDVKKDKRVATF